MPRADASPATPTAPTRLALAWAVHLFTASGALVAVVALFAISGGRYATAALLMLASLLIDSVDGALARAVGVARLIPHIDGRRLDDIVDFTGYAILPTVFLLATGALPHWSLAALPVLASSYGFAQTDAKTEDDFFLGWPSYWNVVALYVWLLDLGPLAATAVVATLAAAVFVPLRYVYPSRLAAWRTPTIVGAAVWGACMVVAIVAPDRARAVHLTEISLVYPAYYLALSAWLGDWAHPRRARR